ncbi:hypothetical protein MJO28_002080 [Puccinia striiformis f. sp. tritici]|uniref:Uncharacterized protein n=1 Tax=Puccinia striiformis f. sp. tritici TaxID=168172 RepID=A0ACC0EWE7_9BASI|nr:hypothetical protein MJO28_002080 [Puccinia striiformis f. sp. tritici]
MSSIHTTTISISSAEFWSWKWLTKLWPFFKIQRRFWWFTMGTWNLIATSEMVFNSIMEKGWFNVGKGVLQPASIVLWSISLECGTKQTMCMDINLLSIVLLPDCEGQMFDWEEDNGLQSIQSRSL